MFSIQVALLHIHRIHTHLKATEIQQTHEETIQVARMPLSHQPSVNVSLISIIHTL